MHTHTLGAEQKAIRGHTWQQVTFEKYFQKCYIQKLAVTVIHGCKMFSLWNQAYFWTPSTWDNQCIWVQGSMQLENCPQSWWQARKLASCIISLAGTTGSAQAAHDTVLSPSLILCLFITEKIGAEWMMSAGADLKAWESHKPGYYTCSVNGQEIITSSWSFCSISVQCAQTKRFTNIIKQ